VYSLSRIHVLKTSDKNLEIVVPASLRYLIDMSLIGSLLLFLHPTYFLIFVFLLGRWEIRKRMSEALMIEWSLVGLEFVFSIWFANFSQWMKNICLIC